MKVSIIGLDLAKNVFQAHGADASGNVAFDKRLRREHVLEFFAAEPPCLVAMEACGGAHYWAREIGELGHRVRLIAPAYVKPFVKRQKNDAADAEAICEAAQRPTLRFFAIKNEAAQASAVVFRARDLLVRQRTQIINARRGHLTEYERVVAQGPAHLGTRPDATATVDRRPAEARRDLDDGGANLAATAYYRRQRGGATGRPAGYSCRIQAGADARMQAADAGDCRTSAPTQAKHPASIAPKVH